MKFLDSFFSKNRKTPTLSEFLLPGTWATENDDEAIIVQKKAGALQWTFAIRGHDCDSKTAAEIFAVNMSFNTAIKRLNDGWSTMFDTHRYETNDYMGSTFDSFPMFLIDYVSKQNFKQQGKHFNSSYYLTFIFIPQAGLGQKVDSLMYKQTGNANNSFDLTLEFFRNKVIDVMNVCKKIFYVYALDKSETLSYLRNCIDFDWQRLRHVKDTYYPLDFFLSSADINDGYPLQVNDYYVAPISVYDLPNTGPGILDELNRIGIEFRSMFRFVYQDNDRAEKELNKYSNYYAGQQISLGQQAVMAMDKQAEGPRKLNKGAVSLEEEADAALVDLVNGERAFGYFTGVLLVWDKDIDVCKDKAAILKKVLNEKDFLAVDEKQGAFEAYLSAMPGNVYSNPRSYLIATNNYAQIVPLTTVWAGEFINREYKKLTGVGAPHLVCNTYANIAYYLNLNINDVGHFMVVGRTGNGKSIFLSRLIAGLSKYPGAGCLVFDKGQSSRQTILLNHGTFINPGIDDTCFQPLEFLESTEDIIWATEWLESLIKLSGLSMNPSISGAINEALKQMQEVEKKFRTISHFLSLFQYEGAEVREALRLYTSDGPYKNLFDSNNSNIGLSLYTCIETTTLLSFGDKGKFPAFSYLLHYCDRFVFTGRLQYVIFEEAHNFVTDPFIAINIKKWLKELRKRHGTLGFVTQELKDFVQCEIFSTLLSQTVTKIYLPDSGASQFRAEYNLFNLTDAEISLLINASTQSDYLIKNDLGTRLFEMRLDELTLTLLDGRDPDFLNSLEIYIKEELATGKETKYIYFEALKKILRKSKYDFDLEKIEDLFNKPWSTMEVEDVLQEQKDPYCFYNFMDDPVVNSL